MRGRIAVCILLTFLSSGGLITYFLQQQHEEKSATFRILYREVTVKLAQHDAIIPLLPASRYRGDVQRLFPQILRWRSHLRLEPRRLIVAEPNGRYWLNTNNLSLLIDLGRLLREAGGSDAFHHLSVSWQGTLLFEQGSVEITPYWQWDKVVASPSQPFVLSAGDNPDWAALPWLFILLPAAFWGGGLLLLIQYRANRRRRDITDLREHYNELTRLNTLGELAAGIMHELNQPLTAILSYNQTALRLIKQQQITSVPDLLTAAVVQIKRTDALLQQFRQRMSSEHADYQPVVIKQIWTRVVMLLDNEITNQKIKISSCTPDDMPPLFAPPLWIEQILHNIASNAIQAQSALPAGAAWLHLNVQHQGTAIVVTLTDGGPGLTELALQQVFMPFFTTRAKGLGLGMALTETLVQRLNGTIEVTNKPEQGACVIVCLPLHPLEE